jgi:hypothetical protein
MIPTLIRSPDASALVVPALAVSVAALPVAALLPASEEPHATRLNTMVAAITAAKIFFFIV